MEIEIWSDVVCPFCYIGKRRFEAALAEFPGRDNVTITWRSFQLDPEAEIGTGLSVNAYLASRKGISEEQAREMNAYVTEQAAELGLSFDFDKAVITNTLDAHRLIHLAKANGKQDAAEELFFRSYFTDGLDLNDHETLISLGIQLGLDELQVSDLLNSDQYADAVDHDQYQAQQLGCKGVPFFVFNNKYGVSGAQAKEVFLEVLQKAEEV